MDPLGAFVFCANSGDDTISVYALDTTFLSATEGQITGEVTGSPVSVSPGSVPISCAVDPTGSFLYVTCQGSEGGSAVQVYSISRSGPTPLTLVSTATPTTSGPTSIALSRSLK